MGKFMNDKDVLSYATKQELIDWMLLNCWHKLPKKSDILFARWQRLSSENLEKSKKETAKLGRIDFKERDRLAKLFNQSTCGNERLKLMVKIDGYDRKLRDHLEKSKKLQAEYEKIQKLYDEHERLREAGL